MQTINLNATEDETLVLPKTGTTKGSKRTTPLRGVTPNTQNVSNFDKEGSANLKSRNDDQGKLEIKKQHHQHIPSFEKTLH